MEQHTIANGMLKDTIARNLVIFSLTLNRQRIKHVVPVNLKTMAIALMIRLDGTTAMVKCSIANGILRRITVQSLVMITAIKEGQQFKHVALAVEVKDDIIRV
mmetsp:Transcript_12659/g.14732  ORF Transcript_12659/g.14732 Transcript_12659/m.14732 type:complete len:103 (+) Transcript_12659:1063-1371(+)